MKMIQNVCIFLTVALIVLSIVLTVITKWYIQLCRQWEDEGNRIETLESDNRQLLNDKRDLIARNEILYEDNVKLADAVKELRAINKELLSFEEDEETAEEKGSGESLTPPADIATNTMRCEPYMIEDKIGKMQSVFPANTHQGMLQEKCYTDAETGIRYYVDADGLRWNCAALGLAYGIEIGTAYEFTLANGTVIPVILADFKHDINNYPNPYDYGDPDMNYDWESCINVIEFIVDLDMMPTAAREAGTMTQLEKFGGLYGHDGNIVDVRKVGRVWKP